MSIAINQIHQGDARDLLHQIEPGSIACSVWSPPYHVGKEYEKGITYEEWIALLNEVIALHYPILKDGGFLVINIADILAFPDPLMPRLQAVNLRRQRPDITREDVLAAKGAYPHFTRYQLAELLGCSEQTIDRRLNGNNIRGGKYDVQTRIHLVGGMIESAAEKAGFYLYDRRIWVKDAAWESSKWHTLSYRAVDEFEYLYFFWKPGITVIDRSKLTPDEWIQWGSRAVWMIPSVRANDDHEAKFPLELPRRVIRLLTSPGDCVLDCFMGSGTTAAAAIREGRNFIGIELLEQYVRLARKTCETELQRKALFDETAEIYNHPSFRTRQLKLMESDIIDSA
jgi:site-specific DNA-methyltransferase (adenine-specific)